MQNSLRTLALIIGSVALAIIAYSWILERTHAEAAAAHQAEAKLERQKSSKQSKQSAISQLKQDIANAQRNGLDEKVTDLELRLGAFEAALAAQETAQNGSDDSEGTPPPGVIAEGDVAVWLDEMLTQEPDTAAGEQALAEAKQAIAVVPGLSIETLSCSKRFCRTTFDSEDGNPPEISAFFGTPPFAGQGFTVEDATGEMVLYFTRPGESLGALRKDALAAR